MREEVEIVTIEAAPGAVVEKDATNKHYPWCFGMVYVLADGQRIETVDRCSRKRDAVARLAELPKAPDFPMAAAFMDGKFFGTRTTIRIGG